MPEIITVQKVAFSGCNCPAFEKYLKDNGIEVLTKLEDLDKMDMLIVNDLHSFSRKYKIARKVKALIVTLEYAKYKLRYNTRLSDKYINENKVKVGEFVL